MAAEEIEANDAIRIDVRMHGYGAVVCFVEGDLGSFCQRLYVSPPHGPNNIIPMRDRLTYRVRLRELELYSICSTSVNRI